MKKIDTETAKKVMDILSNPEMMSKISALASSAPKETPTIQPQSIAPALTSTEKSKTALLQAIKPLLREEKRGKIDSVIKAITIATTVSKLKGGQSNV